ARTSVRRRRRPLCVLGTDTHAIPDPTRRPGGPDAGGDGALTDARIASALHGHSTRISHAGDAHLRARRRTAGLRHRVRSEGLPDQGLHRATPWYTGTEWAGPVRFGMVESAVRHRAGAAKRVRSPVTLHIPHGPGRRR